MKFKIAILALIMAISLAVFFYVILDSQHNCQKLTIEEICIKEECYPVIQQEGDMNYVSSETDVFTQFDPGYISNGGYSVNWLLAHRELNAGEAVANLEIGEEVTVKAGEWYKYVINRKLTYSLTQTVLDVLNENKNECIVIQTCSDNESVIVFGGNQK